jgi:fibronectin-binding autotransporter adhesin
MGKPNHRLLFLLPLLCQFICLQGAASAQAKTATWVGKDTTCPTCWSHSDNWNPPVVPNNGSGVTYNVVIPMPTASGPPQPSTDISATINNLTIGTNASLLIDGRLGLTVNGPNIINNGSLNLSVNSAGLSGFLSITGATALSGSGTVQLGLLGDIEGSGTLTNQLTSQFGIFGQGAIVVLNLVNQGQILGNSSTKSLSISVKRVTNTGTIGTQGFGTLYLLDTTVQNAGGTITGGQGSATLASSTIIGGTLGTQVYQLIVAPSTLNGVTITGDYYITAAGTSGAQTFLQGTITNNGEIVVTAPSGAQKAELTINGDATLVGTGSVLLSGSNAFLDGTGTLTNTQTISSSGSYGNITVKTLGNQATVSSFSSDPSAPLTIQVPVITNTSGIFSSAGGYLTVNGGTFIGGNVVDGYYPITLSNGVTVSGGVTFSGIGSVSVLGATIDGTAATNTNDTTIIIPDNGTLTFNKGFLNLPGTIQLNAAVAETYCSIGGDVTITQTGSITTSNNPNNFVTGVAQNNFAGSRGHKVAPAGSDSLTLNGPSFSGSGTFSGLSLIIDKASSMTNPGGYPLIIDATPFTNSGLLSETSPSGTIQVTGTFSNYNSTTNTLTGGSYNLNGTFKFENANLVTNAANLTLSGFGQIVNQNGVNGLLNFSTNSSNGIFTLSGGQDFSTDGTFTNAGSLTVSKSSTFSIGGSGTHYEQTAGTTTVDGTLTLPTASQANVTGGRLQGAGSFSGSVSVGNASGTMATFIIGDSVKTSAAISIADDYTQLATGIMDVQIGGTNPGTGYSQLTATGPISLQGTLNIKLINKFAPVVGQTFTILTSPSSVTGTFATVNGTSINASEHFAIAYNSDSVVLTVESGPGPSKAIA